MAVPKKRTSKSRKRMRRAHDALKIQVAVTFCQECGEPKLMHRVCSGCGTYRGRQVLAASGEASADSQSES